MNPTADKWTNWLIYGGPMPDMTENWPIVPPVEGFNSFEDEETDGES